MDLEDRVSRLENEVSIVKENIKGVLIELKELMLQDKTVGNQQKWDTLVKERSGRNGSVVGLPEQVVVALSSG